MTDSRCTDTGFEGWLKWAFDHPVTEPEWHWDVNAEDWGASPVVIVDYISRLFEEAPALLSGYSDAQAAQGLWFLGSGSNCEGMPCVYEAALLESQRERCIRSILILFEKYFVTKCAPHLSDVDDQGANPLNMVCYMWWDFLRFPPDNQIANSLSPIMLSTMERILRLSHDACRVSALHGLGHWQEDNPNEVALIIDNFLVSNPDFPEKLRAYALQARIGRVL